MSLAVTGLALNALACLGFLVSDEFGPWVALVGGLFWFIQLLGTLLLRANNTRDAAHLMVWIGALPFLPLGIIGPLGARRVVREAEQDEGLSGVPMPA